MIYYFFIKNVPNNNDESTAANEPPPIQVQQQQQPQPPTTMTSAVSAAATYPMYHQQQSVMITGTEPITPNNLAQPPHMAYLYYTAYPNHPTTPVGLEYAAATIPEYAQTPVTTASYHNPYSPNPLTTGYKSHHAAAAAAVYHSYHYAPATPSTVPGTTNSTANPTAYTWPTPTTPIHLASYSPNDYSKQIFGYNVSFLLFIDLNVTVFV